MATASGDSSAQLGLLARLAEGRTHLGLGSDGRVAERRARADLEVATEKAERAERRLWDSLDIIEDGFAIYDRSGRLVAANSAFLNVFEGMVEVGPGASYDSILRIAVDEGIVDLEGVHPDDWVDDMTARWEQDPIPQRTVKLWNGGFVKLVEITGDNAVVLQFGGGCHGCGMADVTLKQGIEQTLKRQIPEITAVLDATDHQSGTNPYYAANTDGQSAL